MISEKQKQILKLLLTNKEGYNVNQIARILNISVSWTHETLKQLEKEGILLSLRLGNAVFFRINWDNPKAEKLCDLILLDNQTSTKASESKELLREQHQEQVVKVTPKPTNQNFYSAQLNQSTGYATTASIDSPYRQAASQSFNQGIYSITPLGEQGVSNVLFAYAKSGAFSPTGVYASGNASYSSTPVPAGTIGSRISTNVSGFSLSQHTSQHVETTSGCRYCGSTRGA